MNASPHGGELAEESYARAALTYSGIRLICPGDPEWPEQLADLGDEQPYALWLRGTADLRFNCLHYAWVAKRGLDTDVARMGPSPR